jgi:hypothetical protein
MVEIGGTLVEGGVDTLWMGGASAWIKGGTSTLTNNGYNTSIRVGVGTSIGIRYKILANCSARMLSWGSMAICSREGLGTSNEDGVFIATSESVGGSVSWDAVV